MKNHKTSKQDRESLPEQTKLVASEKTGEEPSSRVDQNKNITAPNVPRGTLFNTIDLDLRAENRALPQSEVLELIRPFPRILAAAQLVGRWIWVEFAAPPAPFTRATLSQLGFHWNNKRRLWQHPCGPMTPASPDEPRAKYGSTPAA